MKFQNCILINFVTDAHIHGQAESNMPLQLFQSWGHKNYEFKAISLQPIMGKSVQVLLDFSLTVKAPTLIFISGRGSAISSAKEGKSGFIYNLVNS